MPKCSMRSHAKVDINYYCATHVLPFRFHEILSKKNSCGVGGGVGGGVVCGGGSGAL